MRHNETVMANNTSLVQGVISQWMQERREMLEEIRNSRNEVNDAYGIVRESMMRENQQQHELRMKELEFQRTSEERAMMVKMAPGLLNAYTGKEVVPNEIGDTALVDALAEQISPEQIAQLVQVGVIKQEMAAILTMRIAQVRDKKAKEAETLKKVPAGDTGNVTSIIKAVK
jgi:hypothetical protein